MRTLFGLLTLAAALCAPGVSEAVLFDFDNAPLHATLPLDLTVEGITAHLSATGQGYSIQQANVLGFTPAGFSGYCVYPNSVYLADLLVGFSTPVTDFSIMFAPEEYGCDTSALMRVTAYMDGAYVGTSTATAYPPGTWPTGTLSFSDPQGFNSVVVHYDTPPACGDWGPIFMADNMNVIPYVPSSVEGGPSLSILSVGPNPFRERTVVRFALAQAGPVAVAVHDAQGRLVRTLLAEPSAGRGAHAVEWDGRDDDGRVAPAGLYLCLVRSGAFSSVARMIRLGAQAAG